MVIQRIQTVFLLLAAILMALVSFIFPVFYIPAAEGNIGILPIDNLPLFILQMMIMVLTLVDIFLYKNLRLQITVARITIVLTVFCALIQAYIAKTYGSEPNIWGPMIMYVSSLILLMLALRGMNADQKLLRSYDRIR